MRVLITGASGGIGAACVQRFLDEGHEVVGFDLLPAAIEHERYRHLIVDVREPGSFPGDLEPQVIVNVAGTQDSADDIAANLCGTINVTERYAFGGGGARRQAGARYQIRGQCGVGEWAYGVGVSRLCRQQGRRYRLHQEPCKPLGTAGHRQQCGPGRRYHAAQPLRDGRRAPVESDYGAHAA